MDNTLQRCANCNFWRSPDTLRGHCFLKPPVIMLMPVPVGPDGKVFKSESRLSAPQGTIDVQMMPTCHRPLTLAADFCGEWRMP